MVLLTFCPFLCGQKVGSTLMPPGAVTNRADLDARAGAVNRETRERWVEISGMEEKKREGGNDSKWNVLQVST